MKINLRKTVIIIIGILLNVSGSFLAHNLNFPLWLDMTGTCIASYYTGLWGGIIAAVCNHFIMSIYDPKLLIYLVTGVTSAIVIHIFIRKGYLHTLLKTIVSSFWLGILCTIVSAPLNFIVNSGYSGNMWADILVDMLKWYDVPFPVAAIVGEAVIEILDRQICILLAFAILYTIRRLKAKNVDKAKVLILVLVIGIMIYGVIKPFDMLQDVYVAGSNIHMWETSWYNSYLMAICFEIVLFTAISIISMALLAIRKSKQAKLQMELKKTVIDQIEELQEQQKKTKELFAQTVTALSGAVDAKDRYTSGHSRRVAEYSMKIAARMGKSKEEQEEIYWTGLLHDVGKIRISNDIINKTGRLTDDEYNTIKVHPVTGFHILRGISGSELMAIGAKYHHERYDGSGYPNGLSGDEIPEVARILGVADAYDAMTSNRSYRRALSQEEVRGEIEKGKGTQFDPAIADVMLQMIDEDKEYTMKQGDDLRRRILVVDDEHMNIKLITHIMRNEPMYEIVPANSGKEALEYIEKQLFDLILLDYKMPEMDGIETLKRIREKHQTPVVFITGDKNLSSSTELAEQGTVDYITKPFQPLLLKEIIHYMTESVTMEA